MNNFLNGFADELTKEAAHPLFTAVKKGGTILGQKVKGMVTRATKSKKPRMKKKAEQTLYMEPHKASSNKPGKFNMMSDPKRKKGFNMEADINSKGDDIMESDSAERQWAQGYKKQTGKKAPSLDPKFGGGTGNFEGKQAPPFTDKYNPKDMPQAFGKKAGLFDSAEQKADTRMRSKAIRSDWRAAAKQIEGSAMKNKTSLAGGVKALRANQNSAYKPKFDMQAPENQFGGEGLDTKYGGGTGNFEGKQAPPFTDKYNPKDTPDAFKKKAAGMQTLLRGARQVSKGKVSPERLKRAKTRFTAKAHKGGRTQRNQAAAMNDAIEAALARK